MVASTKKKTKPNMVFGGPSHLVSHEKNWVYVEPFILVDLRNRVLTRK